MSEPTLVPTKDSSNQPAMSHNENAQGSSNSGNDARPVATSTLLQNPLIAMSDSDVLEDAQYFALHNGLAEHVDTFRKGALMAKVYNNRGGYEDINILTEADRLVLRTEEKKRWAQPRMLYLLCSLCAGCAIVQGMDQTVINGAQVRSSLFTCRYSHADDNLVVLLCRI